MARSKGFASYLIIPSQTDEPERYFYEMKRLEWIFIAVRWLWVPLLFIMAWLYHPEQAAMMRVSGGLLAFCNTLASLFNIKIETPHSQRALGISMFIVDTLLAWGIISLFVRDLYTAAYASFIYVVLEAAIRFGLVGSLSMIAVFALGLYGTYEYRLVVFGLHFNTSGYAFWTTLMSIVAISVGVIVHEGRRQRWQSEKYLKESTLLSERNRIARELHDTVLKTLQGLSLEARALEKRTATTTPSVKETAQYIEEVCSRTSQEIREVIFDLRTEDGGIGIASRISKMLNEWSRATGIPSEFTLSGQDMILGTEHSRQLRNIVSEALTNVQRHALASHVQITINTSGDTLNIQISDSGRGIGRDVVDVHVFVAEGKLGIAGMKERVELLGGRLSLSSDQSGTAINLSMPVSQQIRPDSR